MDWMFENENSICYVRVAGVLLKENKILLQKIKDRNEYALLGGQLRFGETLEETLMREYKEEIGAKIVCRRLFWTEENFWSWKGKDTHNLNYYFLIDLYEGEVAAETFIQMNDNKNVEFGWVALDDLDNKKIFSQFLKSELKNFSDYPKHFIRKA